MADVSKRFAKGITTNVSVNVYTVPAGKKAFVKAMTLCNVYDEESKVYVTLAGTSVIGGFVIPAHNTITIPFLDQILEEGETIGIFSAIGKSSSFYISGREVDIE
jgi:hypothetical protein